MTVDDDLVSVAVVVYSLTAMSPYLRDPQVSAEALNVATGPNRPEWLFQGWLVDDAHLVPNLPRGRAYVESTPPDGAFDVVYCQCID